jgi:hypothetical protein
MTESTATLPEGKYCVITPYLLPPSTPKKVNIGDGFILDSAIKLIGARPVALFSSRARLGDADIENINSTRCVIAAGANTLKDDFELTPGFDLATLARIKVPVILMGVGHYGVAKVTRGFLPQTVALFRNFLERFPFLSVRDEASQRYVASALPERSDAILMTSCPVAHRVDDVDRGFVSKDVYDQLVVSLTDRSMLQQQLGLLPAARALFPATRRILALHQDYENAALWNFAEQQGFEVLRSPKYENFLALYAATGVHFGNRLHAHLKCLSYGVRSFLTPFDLRQVHSAESLNYPLIANVPSPEIRNYDFARAAARRDAARATMDRFTAAVRALL